MKRKDMYYSYNGIITLGLPNKDVRINIYASGCIGDEEESPEFEIYFAEVLRKGKYVDILPVIQRLDRIEQTLLKRDERGIPTVSFKGIMERISDEVYKMYRES